jgi:hypothetical protein
VQTTVTAQGHGGIVDLEKLQDQNAEFPFIGICVITDAVRHITVLLGFMSQETSLLSLRQRCVVVTTLLEFKLTADCWCQLK